MSDRREDVGWWQAGDGRWYPPHLHPEYARLQAEVVATTGPAPMEPPVEPPAGPPVVEPPSVRSGPPTGPPPPAATPPGGPPPGPPGVTPHPTVRTLGNNGGWSWFSPPAAVALLASTFVLVWFTSASGIIGFFFLGVVGVWAVRTVVRYREGYGAGAMSAAAVALAVLSVVFAAVQIGRELGGSPMRPVDGERTTTTEPLRPDERIVRWFDLEQGDCFEVPDGGMHSVRTVPCGRAHDAETLVAERGEPVQTLVLQALMSATMGSSTTDPATTPATSDPVAPTDPASPPAAPPTAVPTTSPAGSAATDELVHSALADRCSVLAAAHLVEGAPGTLVVEPVYSRTITTDRAWVLVCTITAADGGTLLRSFTH